MCFVELRWGGGHASHAIRKVGKTINESVRPFKIRMTIHTWTNTTMANREPSAYPAPRWGVAAYLNYTTRPHRAHTHTQSGPRGKIGMG